MMLFNKSANRAVQHGNYSIVNMQSQMNFARYLHRARQIQVDMKENMLSYEYMPEEISVFEPGISYPDPALRLPAKQLKQKRDANYGQERFRTAAVTKNENTQRFQQGRIHSHIKFEEMRRSVQGIKSLEQQNEAKSLKLKQKGLYWQPKEIDDQFLLQYEAGYDHIIKQKAEMIDSQKSENNKMMDELVLKLGYMDYRDALACNKYILEAKRSQDYHQLARAKILQVAIQKQTAQRKVEIEEQIAQQFNNKASKDSMSREELEKAKDQARMDLMMENDPDLSSQYRQTFKDIRDEKEFDTDRINRIHERFDYIKDPENLRNKLKNEIYDLTKREYPEDEFELTTEFSDEGDQEIYYRYKTMMHGERKDLELFERERTRILELKKQQQNRNLTAVNQEDWQQQYNRLNNKILEKNNYDAQIENEVAKIKHMRNMKHLSYSQVYQPSLDPLMNDFSTNLNFEDDVKNNTNLCGEISKIVNANVPELQQYLHPVHDEESAEVYRMTDEVQRKYMRQKWKHHVQKTASQLELTFGDLRSQEEYAEEYDKKIGGRLSFMFNSLDFLNDRARAKQRFLHQMNKKTTLKDIGSLLDRFILDSKANTGRYYDPAVHTFEQPGEATKDHTNNDLHWKGQFAQSFDKMTPLYLLDEDSIVDSLNTRGSEKDRELLQHIKYNDARRDHSINGLTSDEKQEIALFHSVKQDPYFRHYLRTYLSKFQEDMNNNTLTYAGPYKLDSEDHIKFDRINLFDFRRQLPQQEREAKLDSKGRAWGSGKRKSSCATAYVTAGSGKITINGKPLLEYFHLPSQRYRMMLPLSATQYTCLLDVNITVTGGGFTGQCEACVPAISKAVQAYDVNTRPILKWLGLLRNDPRRVERKKPGLLKARKGQVYRRR